MLCNIVSEAQAMKLINILGLDICNEIAALAEDDFSAFPWNLHLTRMLNQMIL